VAYYNRLVAVALLGASIALTGMEIKNIEIKNWGCKERDRGYLGYFLPKQENPATYPYFFPEKDNSESKRCFSDELLFARKIAPIVSEDVTSQILNYAYLTEKTLNPAYMEALEKGFDIKKIDFLYLPMKNKRALQYLFDEGLRIWDDKSLTIASAITGNQIMIEGRDKEFAQKMSQYILDLPLPIRKKLADGTNNHILCNTKYEPSIYNTLLGETFGQSYKNKPYLARLAKIATGGVLTLGGIGILAKADLPKDVHAAVFTTTVGSGYSAFCSTGHQICKTNMAAQDEAMCDGVATSLGVSAGLLIWIGADKYKGVSIKENIKPMAIVGSGFMGGVLAAEGAGLYAHNKVEQLFEENQEERDMRLGFEKISLLKDDEK
jgi:hypothetical protein